MGFRGAGWEVMLAAGMHASRLDGSPLRYNNFGPLPAGSADVSGGGADRINCHHRHRGAVGARAAQKAGVTGRLRVEDMQSWYCPPVPVAGRGHQLRHDADRRSRQWRPDLRPPCASAGSRLRRHASGRVLYAPM